MSADFDITAHCQCNHQCLTEIQRILTEHYWLCFDRTTFLTENGKLGFDRTVNGKMFCQKTGHSRVFCYIVSCKVEFFFETPCTILLRMVMFASHLEIKGDANKIDNLGKSIY